MAIVDGSGIIIVGDDDVGVIPPAPNIIGLLGFMPSARPTEFGTLL